MNARVMALAGLAAILLATGPGLAQVTIETVPVSNVGNAADTRYETPGYGAVGYLYKIGKCEVTAGQYCEFLNAVADDDPYGLYNSSMDSSSDGCQITRNGTSGSYTYDFSGRPSGTEADWANRPVNWVSWGDAARFANWLHNGQPTGPQGLPTTEDGAYYLNGATSDADLLAVNREADWKWAIPTEDEWYKAAYHKNDPGAPGGDYFDYPTSSDSIPSNDLIDPDPGSNATFYDAGYTIGSPYYRTDVGEHENSESPYGTFDQGGNVWEWNEAVIGSCRGLRGGSFLDGDYGLRASYRYSGLTPTVENFIIGFRVSAVPVPGDANHDGCVDGLDYVIWSNNYEPFVPGKIWTQGDYSGDGIVDGLDYIIWSNNYLAGCPAAPGPVPEPGSAALLLTSVVGLLARRRRR